VHLIIRRLFTIIGAVAAAMVLEIEKIGDFFLLVPSDRYVVDVAVAVLLFGFGALLDTVIHQLAEAKRAEEALRGINEALANAHRALKESIANEKVLRGLLPICAACKRIRDDKGYWQQLEVYIREHSDAEFTHGVCPECHTELYGEEHPLEGTAR
jgi:hypothetical protein